MCWTLQEEPPSSFLDSPRSLAVNGNGAPRISQSQNLTSSKLLYEIKVHGFLLWASMGLLTPIGVLSIRMSNKDQCRRRLFYLLHVASQVAAVALATVGAIMSIRNFNNSFGNFHQRLGLGLYFVVWFQALLGFFRPPRGGKARTPWIVAHWLVGTLVGILGVINVYTGLNAYTTKTSRSAKIWTILFTIQTSFIVFFYLFQEKLSNYYHYIRNREISSLPNKPVILSDRNAPGDEFRAPPEKC
ncbi:PREDICTED: cytochrome b561 domain-containing protein At2g30890-like [Tarenaya hassleriana]|uniref:cytochrome b561 domain-containing protein At2g30890-like n=1 Tax=Tarenaya hassleriana TaxID=28532 RepID=UPI00053C6541|nr:PREDICTED: cytochrome b561 domain-containing protein At2g30890-like [Tarenaya hassleriana]